VGQLGFALRGPGVVDGLDGASSYPWRMRFGCIADDLTGREIDPGVPVVVAPGAEGRPAIGLVLKSGNFGGDDFFERALGALAERCR
jgi:uncharacterized protein YgbK (DUF1537 family)